MPKETTSRSAIASLDSSSTEIFRMPVHGGSRARKFPYQSSPGWRKERVRLLTGSPLLRPLMRSAQEKAEKAEANRVAIEKASAERLRVLIEENARLKNQVSKSQESFESQFTKSRSHLRRCG
ncbi:hypothetical protein RIF29_09664 [Crotalaria pallida]|uniref:Uncharacterized protein n=1 Tax=Crotalaria pallida TaxID=3830 RepID=A0AAN9ILN5_CROPI